MTAPVSAQWVTLCCFLNVHSLKKLLLILVYVRPFIPPVSGFRSNEGNIYFSFPIIGKLGYTGA